MFLLVLVISFLTAGALSAVLGLLVGIPVLRLKGDYLAIITLGFGMIIVNIINNLPFCGQQGLSEGSASSALYATGLGFSNDEKMRHLWLVAQVVTLCVAAMFMFVLSKYGRAIRAIWDNEIAASASGINVNYYKALTFTWKKMVQVGLRRVNHGKKYGGINHVAIGEMVVIEGLSKACLTHGAIYVLLGNGFPMHID